MNNKRSVAASSRRLTVLVFELEDLLRDHSPLTKGDQDIYFLTVQKLVNVA